MVKLTEMAPDNGTTEGLGNPLAVVLQSGGTTLWEAKEDVTGNQAFKYYVVVEAKDPAGNDAKAGDDKPADDVISFQLDSQGAHGELQERRAARTWIRAWRLTSRRRGLSG